jgi:hypothetical protein
MISKESFTEAEWTTVNALPAMVMGGAALSDGRKLVTTIREVLAGSEAFKTTAAKYPDNALIASFLSVDQKPTVSSTDENSPSPRNVAEAVELVTKQIGDTVAVVRDKATPEEFAQIREVLLAAATAAVEATGSGPMGFGGDKISEGESAFITKLTEILN